MTWKCPVHSRNWLSHKVDGRWVCLVCKREEPMSVNRKELLDTMLGAIERPLLNLNAAVAALTNLLERNGTITENQSNEIHELATAKIDELDAKLTALLDKAEKEGLG